MLTSNQSCFRPWTLHWTHLCPSLGSHKGTKVDRVGSVAVGLQAIGLDPTQLGHLGMDLTGMRAIGRQNGTKVRSVLDPTQLGHCGMNPTGLAQRCGKVRHVEISAKAHGDAWNGRIPQTNGNAVFTWNQKVAGKEAASGKGAARTRYLSCSAIDPRCLRYVVIMHL